MVFVNRITRNGCSDEYGFHLIQGIFVFYLIDNLVSLIESDVIRNSLKTENT